MNEILDLNIPMFPALLILSAMFLPATVFTVLSLSRPASQA